MGRESLPLGTNIIESHILSVDDQHKYRREERERAEKERERAEPEITKHVMEYGKELLSGKKGLEMQKSRFRLMTKIRSEISGTDYDRTEISDLWTGAFFPMIDSWIRDDFRLVNIRKDEKDEKTNDDYWKNGYKPMDGHAIKGGWLGLNKDQQSAGQWPGILAIFTTQYSDVDMAHFATKAKPKEFQCMSATAYRIEDILTENLLDVNRRARAEKEIAALPEDLIVAFSHFKGVF